MQNNNKTQVNMFNNEQMIQKGFMTPAPNSSNFRGNFQNETAKESRAALFAMTGAAGLSKVKEEEKMDKLSKIAESREEATTPRGKLSAAPLPQNQRNF